jgi:hypothetical protein
MRGRGLVAAGVLVCTGVAAACTDGTTPDCSDAQCLPVIVVAGGGDALPLADAQMVEGGGAGRAPDSGGGLADAAGLGPSDGSVDSSEAGSPDVRDAGGGD